MCKREKLYEVTQINRINQRKQMKSFPYVYMVWVSYFVRFFFYLVKKSACLLGVGVLWNESKVPRKGNTEI